MEIVKRDKDGSEGERNWKKETKKKRGEKGK